MGISGSAAQSGLFQRNRTPQCKNCNHHRQQTSLRNSEKSQRVSSPQQRCIRFGTLDANAGALTCKDLQARFRRAVGTGVPNGNTTQGVL
jgi:hypothetical protein